MQDFKDNPRRDEMAALIKEGVPRNMIVSLMDFPDDKAVTKKARYWGLPEPARRMDPKVYAALKACRLLQVGNGWRVVDDCPKIAQSRCPYRMLVTRVLNVEGSGTYYFLHDGPMAWVFRLRGNGGTE